tara:strand:- start:1252 stop:1557 length:306 start_codon:yes stop_codon:yes gene_type:complete
MAMFRIRMLKENRHMAATNINGVCAHPMAVSPKLKKKKDTTNGIRLSNLETNHPDIGKPIKELMGMANKRLPNSASLKLKFVFMVGIRDAQVAKQKPERKK